MSGSVTFMPMILARTIEDRHAMLGLVDGELALVIVRLDHEAHEELRGRWVIELGFGPYDAYPGPDFADLHAVEAWMKERRLRAADAPQAPARSA